MSKVKISGELVSFGLSPDDKRKRKYFVATIPFKIAHQIFSRRLFNGETGRGEQRNIDSKHVSKLAKAVENNEFTPTVWGAELTKTHIEQLQYHDNGRVTLELDLEKFSPIPLIDGGHRNEGLFKLRKKFEEEEQDVSVIDNQPVTVMIYCDGDPKLDFIRLQEGKPVSRNHLISLRHAKGDLDKPQGFAFEVIKCMADEDSGTFLANLVSFDTRTSLGLTINGLIGTNASDICGSAVAGARICLDYEQPDSFLAQLYQDVYDTIHDQCVELTEQDKLFQKYRNGGKKGSINLIIGIGNMLAFRLCKEGRDGSTDDDLNAVAVAIQETMSKESDDIALGVDVKRRLFGAYAQFYFADMVDQDSESPLPAHHGIPIELLEKYIAPSSFGVPALPKTKKGS